MAFVTYVLRPNELFVDAVSNIGSYSILAAAGAKVIAIEPIPSTFQSLVRNATGNGLLELIETRHVGLAHESGQLRFTTDQDSANHVMTIHEDAAGEEIPVTTLDELLQKEEEARFPQS